MRHALAIVSLLSLAVLVVAVVGQALVYALGVTYTPEGQPTDPTPLAYAVSFASSFGGLLAMPFTCATFILGLVATADARRYGWLAALLVAALLALAGLIAMAWVILSVRSPLAFQTPLLAIPLVTTLYTFLPASRHPPVPRNILSQ
jgi:hypothetical protein